MEKMIFFFFFFYFWKRKGEKRERESSVIKIKTEKSSIKIYDIFKGLLVANVTYGWGPGSRWVEERNLEKTSCIRL